MNKDKFKRFLRWLFFDPLQFWILIIIIIFQRLAIYIFHLDSFNVNKYLGPFLQIIGGLIILIIINENIELFKHINLVGVFLNWVKSCPLFKKTYKLNAQGSIQLQAVTLKANLITKRKSNTIDELQEELHRQIDSIIKIISETEKDLLKRIVKIEDSLKEDIEKNKKEIQEVKNLASESAIGDFKWEILGVLLIIYGAVIYL